MRTIIFIIIILGSIMIFSNVSNQMKKDNEINHNQRNIMNEQLTIDKLYDLGYQDRVINFFMENLNQEQLSNLIQEPFNKFLDDMILLENFNYNHLKEYENYYNKYPNSKPQEVIDCVELHKGCQN